MTLANPTTGIHPDDTIVAVSSAHGPGARAIVRSQRATCARGTGACLPSAARPHPHPPGGKGEERGMGPLPRSRLPHAPGRPLAITREPVLLPRPAFLHRAGPRRAPHDRLAALRRAASRRSARRRRATGPTRRVHAPCLPRRQERPAPGRGGKRRHPGRQRCRPRTCPDSTSRGHYPAAASDSRRSPEPSRRSRSRARFRG